MKLKQLFLLFFAISVLLVPAAFAQEDEWEDDDYYETQHFKEHFTADLGGIDSVRITIVSGGIKVKTWAGDSIEIEVDEKVRKLDSSEAAHVAEEVRLVSFHSGSELEIELEYGSLDEQYVHRHYSSALTVMVPARLSLDLNTVSGGIRVATMEGDVTAETVSGGVELEGCGGDAFLKTVSGGVTCGSVKGELRAEAVSGGLDLVGGHGDITGNTVSGGITIRLPAGVGYRISASTFSGKVRDNLSGFSSDYDRRHKKVRGTVGDGTYRVSLRTTSGGITINEK